MKIRNMKSILKSEKFDNCECNFKLKSKGPQAPEWFKEFVNNQFKPAIADINSRIDHLENRFNNLENRFDNLESRIDHLVKVNNLKE